jgi:hypothetical protein
MSFTFRDLSPDRVAAAYPLLWGAEGISLEQWQRYADSVIGPRCARNGTSPGAGVVAIEDPQGCIHGLFTYRRVEDLTCGTTLQCDGLFAAHLVNPRRVHPALIDAMVMLARKMRCTALRVSVPYPDADGAGPDSPAAELRTTLQEAGFAPRDLVLCRPVEGQCPECAKGGRA